VPLDQRLKVGVRAVAVEVHLRRQIGEDVAGGAELEHLGEVVEELLSGRRRVASSIARAAAEKSRSVR